MVRRYSDYGVRLIVEDQHLAGKPRRHAAANHHYARAVGEVLFRGETSPADDINAPAAKQIRRGLQRAHLLHGVAIREIHDAAVERRHGFENARERSPVFEFRRRGYVVAAGSRQRDEPVRVFDGQRLQNDGVDDGEDRRRRADAQASAAIAVSVKPGLLRSVRIEYFRSLIRASIDP